LERYYKKFILILYQFFRKDSDIFRQLPKKIDGLIFYKYYYYVRRKETKMAAELIIFIYSNEDDEESSKNAVPVEPGGIHRVPPGRLPFLFVNPRGTYDYACPQLDLTVHPLAFIGEFPDEEEHFSYLLPVIVFMKSDIYEQHGFQMMGPGWKWIHDEARWEKVPQPSEPGDWVWSSIQTWEKRCSECKCDGCCVFDLGEKSWMLDLSGAKRLFTWTPEKTNFCGQETICWCCNQCYNPTDPQQKKHHGIIDTGKIDAKRFATYCRPNEFS
jgi:hypothetical protein